jgi:hypothetical protein
MDFRVRPVNDDIGEIQDLQVALTKNDEELISVTLVDS